MPAQEPQPTSINGGVEVQALVVEESDDIEAPKRETRAVEEPSSGEAEGAEDSVDETSDSNRKRKCFVLLLLLLIVGVVAAYFGTNGFKSKDENPAGTASPTPADSVLAIVPTMPPGLTPSPTVVDHCSVIANGQPLEDQDTMVTQEYDILLDVSLESALPLAPITLELTRKIQQVIVPYLAGCSEVEVGQRTNSGITNGLVQAQHDSEGRCADESSSPCYRYKINLLLYVEQLVKSYDFTDMINANFQQAPLVQRLELSVPTFVNINVVASLTPTPTSSPSCKYIALRS